MQPVLGMKCEVPCGPAHALRSLAVAARQPKEKAGTFFRTWAGTAMAKQARSDVTRRRAASNGQTAGRAVLAALCLVLALAIGGPTEATAQDKTEASGYGVRTPGRALPKPTGALPQGATSVRAKSLPTGRVDVICGPRDASLAQCIENARASGQGVFELPPAIAYEHLPGLFQRGLRYYDLSGDFSRYRGYRFVMTFRRLSNDEIGDRATRRAGAIGAGLAGGMALSTITPFVPLTPVIFLFDSATAEMDRARAEADARERGVPLPDLGSFETTYDDYGRTYRGYLGGSLAPEGEDGVYATYVVTSCSIERPGPKEAARQASARPGAHAAPKAPSETGPGASPVASASPSVAHDAAYDAKPAAPHGVSSDAPQDDPSVSPLRIFDLDK